MRGTAARRGAASQSVEVTAGVDDVDRAVSEDVTVPVVADELPDVMETRSIQRSRIRASSRSSSIISRWTLPAPVTFSGSSHPCRWIVDVEEPASRPWPPRPAGRVPELSDRARVSDISESSGGDMLQPLLLLVPVVFVFDDASHAPAVTDRGITSHRRSACPP